MKLILKIIFAFLAIGVGLYPILYLVADMSNGLLASKGDLIHDSVWNTAFYSHIAFGALALLSGWSQFFKGLRTKYLNLHRNLGKVYCGAVLVSGITGLYVAFYALGGPIAKWGFIGMDIAWLSTMFIAYKAIRRKEITMHQNWMIRSYAVCFAAVTLRLWLPIFAGLTEMTFVESYRIIAWISWVPNLIVAEIIIYQQHKKQIRGIFKVNT